jgi:hypothetical protein
MILPEFRVLWPYIRAPFFVCVSVKIGSFAWHCACASEWCPDVRVPAISGIPLPSTVTVLRLDHSPTTSDPLGYLVGLQPYTVLPPLFFFNCTTHVLGIP